MKDSALMHTGVIKKSNIRIWIHHRDLAHLQKVVWEGHGSKLLVEHSNNTKVKKFLEAIPNIMGLIKDIHMAVHNDDIGALKAHTSPPIPPIVLSGKDANGLTPLHKAAGLGREEIAEYIIEQYPESVNIQDNDGRTPLHYATLAKDNGKLFNLILESGAEESILDNKQKTAAYYKTRSNELDSKLLQTIPDCPRSAKESFATTFDWGLITAGVDIIPKVLKFSPPPETNGNEEHDDPTTDKLTEDSPDNQNDIPSEETENDMTNGDAEEPETSPPAENEEEQEEKSDEPEKEDVEETAPEVDEPQEEESPQGEEQSQDEESPQEQDPPEEDPPQNEEEQPPQEESGPDESAEPNESEEPIEQNEDDPNEPKSELASVEVAETADADDKPIDIPTETSDTQAIDEGEGVIEGVVNGENEIESLNEQGQGVGGNDRPDEAEISALIEEGNMERLASLVLNGEGDMLVGHQSENPEIQAFLDNVATYMSKINRIHTAARDGNLRDLQAALDRRKFAIAKDSMSPNGSSPLHVAVIFGNTSIVRYLAGRFPETVLAVDDNGRTPLHYSAALDDNGHYFNLLVHLGSDVRAEDKLGHAADYYRSDRADLSHNSLLRDFGAEEAAEEILNDKDKPANNVQVDMPFFYTEEGRYLASSLGDPLIKGLTEVANKRPDDPIAYLAQYLYNFANSDTSRAKTQVNQENITGSPQLDNYNTVPRTIDVVTVAPGEESQVEDDSAFNVTSRDEHGQSMLHFAAARSHGRNALFQLLQETNINVGYRDELYRSARDISIQANIPENTYEIDKYVMFIACKGDTDKLVELLLNGYDHITDIVDEDDVPIVEAVSAKNQTDTVSFLQSILTFEEKRERVHHEIRQGAINEVTALLADEKETGSGKLLAIGKNSYGRCSLHIAVLCQQEEIVDFLVNTFPETLHVGDNLGRTALHYAMGVEKMESISKLLIKGGALRVIKDLKGRQPTYYFMNKSDILRLQEEEETF